MKYKIGDRVHHAAYGDGTVIGQHYGRGENVMVAVEFDIPQVHFHRASTYGGKSGKANHCWYVDESELTPINNPSWILIVRTDKSDPDTTIAVLKVGKDTIKTETVKRHYKDTYDRDAAIRAVVDKMYPKVEMPVREVQRPAVEGEYVKTLKNCKIAGQQRYFEGDILKCTMDFIDTGDSLEGRAIGYDNSGWVILNEDYLVLENYTPPVEPKLEEPKPPKPIMINGKELRVGSKFILRPYEEVDNHHGVSKSDWDDDFGKILVVSKVYASETPPYIDTENGCYLYCCDAIDRILED